MAIASRWASAWAMHLFTRSSSVTIRASVRREGRPRDAKTTAVTIIVAGHLFVDPAARDEYLRGCIDVMVLARRTAGCEDFSLTADPIDDRRINIFEQWDSVESVEAFRGSGQPDEQTAAILDAEVHQHVVSSSTRL